MSEARLPLRHGPLVALLCAAAALAACNTDERQVTFAGWRQQELIPQPRLEGIPVSHPVGFAPLQEELEPAERDRLVQFLQQSGVHPGDSVLLTIPPPEPNRPDLTAGRVAALRTELARLGVPARTDYRPGAAGLTGDQILVTAEVLTVVAPNCPGYNAPIAFDFEHRPVLSFGCANATNLGLMVANPNDLARGQPLSPGDGTAAAAAVERYRTGKVWPEAEPQSQVPFRIKTN